MKRLLVILGIFLQFFLLQAQTQTFLYSKSGEQILFNKNDTIQYVHFVPETKGMGTVLNNLWTLSHRIDTITSDIFRCDLTGKSITAFISAAEKTDIIASLSSEYRLPGSKTLRWIEKNIYVRMKEGMNIEDALNLSQLAYTSALPVGSFPRLFSIQLDNEDIFTACQLLYETGMVLYAEPSFHYLLPAEQNNCVSSSSYSKDWNLKEVVEGSTYGINAMNAWNITTGNPNIKIAIFDDGVKNNHPALINNIEGGFTSPILLGWEGLPGGWAAGNEENGTRVSGIIASTNNTQANYGVARDSKITSVKARNNLHYLCIPCFDRYYTNDQAVLDALKWAMDNNMDIVNFSWSLDEIDDPQASVSLGNLEDRLNDLSTNGRNGKGIVIVSSSGNNKHTSVGAPASLDNIIAVGATTPEGYRANRSDWGSNYGTKLDIVAPGENILTTCNYPGTCYYWNYQKTWAAAAHVAGVAALILSVNPNLTAKEVKDIIEKTAYKARSGDGTNNTYKYQITSGRPNGTWHQEMGYGLVNAHAAVVMALDMLCYDINSGLPMLEGTIQQNTTWSTPVFVKDDISIANGVTLTATSTVVCAPGTSITIEPGGKLLANGATFTNACDDKMWKGIVVKGDPTKTMTQSNQGYMQITNESVIENAEVGILVQGGGMIVLNNVDLNNNTTGAKFEPLSPLHSGTSGTFTDTRFYIDKYEFLGGYEQINEPFLIMNSCGDVLVTDCNFWHWPHNAGLSKAIEVINNTLWSGLTTLGSLPINIRAGGALTNTGTIRHLGDYINVYPTGKLLVNGGIHTNVNPFTQWPGILVLGDKTKPIHQIYQGFVQITNNGKIENAACALTLKDGGIINTNGAQFFNNKVAVKFEPVASTQIGESGRFINTSFVIDENSFIGNTPNDEPHILMDNCGEVVVSSCSFTNPSLPSFSKGIEVNNSATLWNGNNTLSNVPVFIRLGGVFTNKGTISHLKTGVTVFPGSKLLVNGGTHKNSNPFSQWPGINVIGDITKPLQQIHQGFVQITNNGKIENAVCALTLTNGALVQTDNAVFKNNTIGVKLEPIASTQSGVSGNFTNTSFAIDETTFIGLSPNDEPHIQMNNCGEVLVSNCSFTNPSLFSFSKGIEVNETATQWSGNNTLSNVPVSIRLGGVFTNTGTIGHYKSGITVFPGSKLWINGGTHKNSVSFFQWPGIIALGDPSQPLNQNVQSFVEITNNGKIENAVCALRLSRGAIVQATNAQFVNNTLGVKIESLAQGQSGISGTFTDTHFILDEYYLEDPDNHEPHLLMNNCGEVLVTNSNFENLVSLKQNCGISVINTSTSWDENNQLHFVLAKIQSNGLLATTNESTLQLSENSKIVVEVDGTLQIGENALVYGNSSTDTAIHIKGGDFIVGEDVVFQDLPGGILLENAKDKEGLPIYDDNKSYFLEHITFNNTPLTHRGSRAHIAFCTFNPGSNVKSEIGTCRIWTSIFNNTVVWANHSDIKKVSNKIAGPSDIGQIVVNGSHFIGTNSNTAIKLNYTCEHDIYGNTITGYKTGISLSTSGNIKCLPYNRLMNNEISNCNTGVEFFYSRSEFRGNYFHNNTHGVKLFNNSYTTFAWGPSEPNIIQNCDSIEVYASENSFPTYFHYNKISDANNQGNSSDIPLFWWDVSKPDIRDVTYNCWGNNFNPLYHLYPSVLEWDPVWDCKGKSGLPPRSDDEELYLAGLDYFANEDYTNAETTFKELIQNYPVSRFAIAALHELFALEHFTNNDFYSLNSFYATITPSDSNLFNTADFLATRCLVKERDWQPAVDWYEERITNPPSYQDSVFAVIDLGDIHLMMESDTMNGGKSAHYCHYSLPNIKPKSRMQYEENKTSLLATLPQIKNPKNDKNTPSNDKYIPLNDKKGSLGECVPNPTNGNATISYEIFTGGVVEIQLFNSIGQMVKSLPQGKLSNGNYKATISVVGMPVGVYHYTLVVNGERVDSKRVVVN